jgi:hypothetical protein
MVFELSAVTIAIGILYGYFKRGKEDRMALLKKGALIGIIIAIILVAVAGLLSNGEMLLAGGFIGIFVFINVIILAVLFILGTFIGDWLEEKSKVE